MCGICGCSDGTVTVTKLDDDKGVSAHTHIHTHAHDHDHTHDHSHSHSHSHGHDHAHTHMHRGAETMELEAAILGKNDEMAAENREWLSARNITALNLVSSPGSGKTTLLERTLSSLKDQLEVSVIEGDQATLNDAERIRATGTTCVQVNTGTGCHLEANMIRKGLEELEPSEGSLLMIENVGNLVCPALFDLGERAKVLILSVTEGDDKPSKYPHMIAASDVLVINKIDLLPYVSFDVDAVIAAAREINPDIQVFQVSATTGEGMEAWFEWLLGQAKSDSNLNETHAAE